MFKIIYLVVLIRIAIASFTTEEELLERTIQALNKTFDFVLDNNEHMNVDGILGINIAQALLRKAVLKASDPATQQKLWELIETAKSIYALRGPLLQSSPYKYYVFNNYILPPDLWMTDINFSYGKLDLNPPIYSSSYDVNDVLQYFDYIQKTTFNEEQSDACLVELATSTNDTKPHDCPASDFCADYLLTMPTQYLSRFPGYGVTHMLLYLQIARMRNCNIERENFIRLVEQECSYILWEMRKNVEYKYIPNLDDLLLEQIDFCGFEGFGEFLEEHLLRHILERQTEHGGFALNLLRRKAIADRQRHKRESEPMPFGCNSHTTGLGAHALALFIRVLIEKPFSGRAFYKKL